MRCTRRREPSSALENLHRQPLSANVKNLKISARLSLVFGLLLLLLAVISLVGINRLHSLDATTTRITANTSPKIEAAREMSYQAVDATRLTRNLILERDDAIRKTHRANLEQSRAGTDKQMAVLDRLVDSDRERVLLAASKARWRTTGASPTPWRSSP